MECPLTYVWLAAFVIGLATSAYAASRLRGHPGRALAVWPTAAAAFWALSAALANLATTPAQVGAVDGWMSWAWAALPYALLVASVHYTGDARWLTWPRLVALAIPGALCVACAMSGLLHGAYLPAGTDGVPYFRAVPTARMMWVAPYMATYLGASLFWLVRHARLGTRRYVLSALRRVLIPVVPLFVVLLGSNLLPPGDPHLPVLGSLVASAGFTVLAILTIRAHVLLPPLETATSVRASTRQIEHFLGLLPDAGAIVDQAGRVLVANQPAAELVGKLTPAGLVTSDTLAIDYVEPADRKYVLLSVEQLRRGVPLRGLRAHILRPGGPSTPVDVSAVAANVGADEGYFVVTLRDISAYERAVDEHATQRERVERSKRVESLAALAGGLTHDLNNLLAVIRGNLELLREDGGGAVAALPYIDRAATAVSRAAGLTDDLLAYLGQRRPSANPTSLAALVTDAVATYHPPDGATADITVRHKGPSPSVSLSPKDARRLIHNLLDNGVEATPVTGGEQGLAVTVAEEHYGADATETDTVTGAPIPAGRYGVVIVSDRGPGIPGDRLDRMFDPFVTTKRTGRGLGLSIVLGIVRGCGGYLSVRSEPGRGTSVTVLLPVAQAGATSHLRADERLRLVR